MTQTEGLVGTPSIVWMDSLGQQITSTGDIILSDPVTSGQATSQILYFDPIRTSDEGTYTCMAMLSSSALTTPLNSSTTNVVTVQQSKTLWLKSLLQGVS